MTETDKFVKAMKIVKHHHRAYRNTTSPPLMDEWNEALRAACKAWANVTWPEGVFAPNAKANYRAFILHEVFGDE